MISIENMRQSADRTHYIARSRDSFNLLPLKENAVSLWTSRVEIDLNKSYTFTRVLTRRKNIWIELSIRSFTQRDSNVT